MEQDITPEARAQAVTWETLEAHVRERVQGFVQEVLEEEVTELLGRGKSERRAVVDSKPDVAYGTSANSASTTSATTLTEQTLTFDEKQWVMRYFDSLLKVKLDLFRDSPLNVFNRSQQHDIGSR